jgi:hypothetical protein
MAKSTYEKLKEKLQETDEENTILKKRIKELETEKQKKPEAVTIVERSKEQDAKKIPENVGSSESEKITEVKLFIKGKCKVCTKATRMDPLCGTFRQCPYYKIYTIVTK